VPSPAAGVIKNLYVKDGDTVTPGTKLCSIEVGATGNVSASPKAEAPKPAAPTPPPPPPPPPPQAPKASMPVAAIKHAQVRS
jgi:pyruvate/2-oxoglutarate dehydrogenase complex dihydrolipoamide acyltransferase (E2) component